jgi:hypothetical protein
MVDNSSGHKGLKLFRKLNGSARKATRDRIFRPFLGGAITKIAVFRPNSRKASRLRLKKRAFPQVFTGNAVDGMIAPFMVRAPLVRESCYIKNAVTNQNRQPSGPPETKFPARPSL